MRRVDQGVLFVRFSCGDADLIALSDGYLDTAVSSLRTANGHPFGTDLPDHLPLFDGQLRLDVNAFLVILKGQHTLIDTGASNAWLPTMGRLFEALDEAGISREEIETVALTHTHADHVHGLVAPDGDNSFPNLRKLWVPLGELGLLRRHKRLERFFDTAAPVQDGTEVAPGITAVAAHGHEVGHTAYRVALDDATVLIWGDIVQVPSMQFAHPEFTWEFDADQNAARETRLALLRDCSDAEVFVAGAHLDFPGVGRVDSTKKGYSFQSV